jgi:antirestriction protein ArdC
LLIIAVRLSKFVFIRVHVFKTFIVQAAAQAQKAADFILGRKFADAEEAHD